MVMVPALAGLASADDVIVFDDGQRALWVRALPSIFEPAIPTFVDGTRVRSDGSPTTELFNVVEVYDRVPGTGSFPLTVVDIIANGYVRPLVQHADGLTGSIGTSIVTGPAFRPQGEPLDTTPDMLRADVGTVTPNTSIIGLSGNYSGKAFYFATHAYPDPLIGETIIGASVVFRAQQPITLDSSALGSDAFRICWFSSMLADDAGGLYDANTLRVTRADGTTRALWLGDRPRGQHLFAQPLPIEVGGSVTLHKDNAGVWNAGSPSVRIELLGVSSQIGQLGVQGYLASTTNPNDDSLSVWIEWVDAPATIEPGTQLEVSFLIVATDPTDPGDLDHSGTIDRRDAWRLMGLLGRTEADADFDAYGDLDRSHTITAADVALLVAAIPCHPADENCDGLVDAVDFFLYLDSFVGGQNSADITGDGIIDALDFFAYLDFFSI